MNRVILWSKKYSHINWTLADQAMVSGVNFLTGLVVARFLGLEEFGRFTLLWMGILFVNSIQMAVISAPMMSIGPKQSLAEDGIYYRAVVFQQLLFSFVTFAVLFLGVKLAVVLKPEWYINDFALPLAVAGFFFQNQDFLRRYFFSRQRADNAFWNDVVSYLGQLVLLCILFSTTDFDALDVLWVIGGTSAVAVIFGLTKIEKKFPNITELKTITERHWDFSKWSVLSALLQWASGNLVFILTGSLLGAASVGVLKAAQNIMAVSHILFQAMENFVPAQASKKFAKSGINELRLYKNKVSIIGVMITAAFALAVSVYPEALLTLVYGEEYSAYGYVLQWFALIYIFMFLGFPLRAALRAVENTKAIFFSKVVASIFVVVLGYPIIQNFELIGALVSLLFVYVGAMIFLHFSFSNTVNLLDIETKA